LEVHLSATLVDNKAKTCEANLQTQTIKRLIQWSVSVPSEKIGLGTLQSTDCAITFLAPLPGNTDSIFLNDTFSVSLSLKAFIL
jgi:hypothetical protein